MGSNNKFTAKLLSTGLSLGLFLLALLPRAYDLQRFVTADESKWVYRSAQFLAAFLAGDWAATSVNLTPAVTTTWLGSLGLAVYYWLNQAVIALPFSDWLISLPEFRVDLPVLAATRWPMVIFTSLAVVAIYGLLRRLFHPALAFLAAAFIALDPHFIALSRIIGHDAPTVVFMSLSVLLLLLAVKPVGGQGSRGAGEMPALFLLGLSGIAAGLAFLSKAPALFLIPFTGLVLIVSEIQFCPSAPLLPRSPAPPLLYSLTRPLSRFLLWGLAAYLTFVIFWPAAWVEPVGRPLTVFENAFLSATDQEEAGEEGFFLVPDLGPTYYLVNGAFKLSPLVLVGAGLAVIFGVKQLRRMAKQRMTNQRMANGEIIYSLIRPFAHSPILWLFIFAVLFTIFMTLSDKRSPRYILPIFPALAMVAAWGWFELGRGVGEQGSRGAGFTSYALRFTKYVLPLILIISACLILLPYAPYYFTYYNPLLGGSYTAPGWVKIGWGEGLDRVGRFLQRENNTRDSRVGTVYASTVAPFFEGKLSGVTGDRLDYVVLYLKQAQSGEPSPTFVRYFQQQPALFGVNLNGLHYADVYAGPTLQMLAGDGRPGSKDSQPLAFRPLTLYGRIGEPLEVEVIWPVDSPLSQPVNVTLTASGDPPGKILAAGAGQPTPLAPDLITSRHRLNLPADLPQGVYTLWLADNRLGDIELRRFQPPTDLGRVENVIFNHELALTGYQFAPTADFIGLKLAWQAQTSRLPDYTMFAQLLNVQTGERVAGVDAPPLKGAWPTGQWVKAEVVVDDLYIAIPPDLPPGMYNIIVGLYRPDTGQRLTLPGGQDFWLVPWTYEKK